MLPSSTVSGGSGSVSGSYSRSTGVGLGRSVQRTPFGKVRQRTKRSEDGRWEQQGGVTGLGLTAHRPSTKTDRRSVDFVFDSEDTNPQQVLLPPIELQPSSPLRTIAQAAVEPTPNGDGYAKRKDQGADKYCGGRIIHNLWLLLYRRSTCIDYHREHLPAFSTVPSSPLSVSTLAPPRTPQPTSSSTSSSSLFFTPTGSPFPPASPNKLAVGVCLLPGK